MLKIVLYIKRIFVFLFELLSFILSSWMKRRNILFCYPEQAKRVEGSLEISSIQEISPFRLIRIRSLDSSRNDKLNSLVIQSVLLFLIAGFFVCENIKAESLPDVIINEVAWMGTINSSGDEWIELKNLSNKDISLEGWSLIAQDGSPEIYLSGVIKAGQYFLLERTDDESVPDVKADLFYSGALGNSGEFLGLADNNKNLIDFVDMASEWTHGENDSKKTMERLDNLGWQTSVNVGGTPKQENSKKQQENETPATVSEQTFSPVSALIKNYNSGDIVINEFVSDPKDEDTEWIELYNNTEKQVDLENWYIKEGRGTKTKISGMIDRFFVVNEIKGSLNNKGDSINLYDDKDNLIDKVIYGEWEGDDKAPLAEDPNSTARKIDGSNALGNEKDFAITSILTKGERNIISLNSLEAEEGKAIYDGDIVISEIFPNPRGDDSQEEFIELYNKSDRVINLKGYALSDSSDKRFEIKENKKIKPFEYLAFKRKDTKIVLNNSGDSVRLFKPQGKRAVEAIKYNRAEEDWSYVKGEYATSSKSISDNWYWTKTVTPNKVNYIDGANNKPIVNFDIPKIIKTGKTFIFDGSDSEDKDGDSLFFNWDFGDGIKLDLPSPGHTYLKEGVYVLKLTVSDGEEESIVEKTIKVIEENKEVDAGEINVIINEVFPNPKGVDKENEFIEIKNNGDNRVNLKGWKLADTKDEYKFEEDFFLNAKEIVVIEKTDSKISLNNTSEEIKLLDSGQNLVSSVKYDFSFEDNAFALGKNNNWFWTTMPTPGEENIISFAGADFLDKGLNFNSDMRLEVDLEIVKDLEAGTFVKTSGVVMVEPGILGSQYFYINGIQIYNYKKDFPELAIGDYIDVEGEISVSSGEKRIKTKNSEDIEVIENLDLPEAEILNCEEANSEKYIGRFVEVEGEVVDKEGATIYIDDGTSELKVYIKKMTNINIENIKEEGVVTVRGILNMTRSGVRLLPRTNEDLEIAEGAGEVSGKLEENNEWHLEARNKKQELLKYLLVILSGVIIILGGVAFRLWNKSKQ